MVESVCSLAFVVKVFTGLTGFPACSEKRMNSEICHRSSVGCVFFLLVLYSFGLDRWSKFGDAFTSQPTLSAWASCLKSLEVSLIAMDRGWLGDTEWNNHHGWWIPRIVFFSSFSSIVFALPTIATASGLYSDFCYRYICVCIIHLLTCLSVDVSGICISRLMWHPERRVCEDSAEHLRCKICSASERHMICSHG